MAIDLKQRGPGHPTLLTDKVADDIYKYMADGNYASTACQAAGIKYDTFLNWQERAKEYNTWLNNSDISDDVDLCDLPDHNGDLVYFQFFHRLKTAEAQGEASHVHNLSAAGAAGPQYWAASATFLERKYPDRWGKRDALDINVADVKDHLDKVAKALREPDKPKVLCNPDSRE